MAKTKPETKTSPASGRQAAKQPTSTTPSRFSKFIPYIAALVTFIVITLIFFGPRLFDDKSLAQGDINQFDGMSKEVSDFRAKTNTEPLWTNSMFGGMPAFQISTLYKGNLIQYVEKIVDVVFPDYAGYLFIAAIGFYLLLLVLGIDAWLAIAGAIAYSLASYNLIILEAGHNSKMNAIALLPYVATGFFLLWNKKYLLGAAVSAMAFSLLISANHIQIAYYLFLILLIAGIVFGIYAILNKDIKHYILAFGIFAGCGVLGVASNLSMLWSTYEYGNATIRGKSDLTSNTQSKGGLDRDYAFGWSYGKMELMDLMIPNFMGGSSNQKMDEDSKTVQAIHGQTNILPMYWGDQPFTSGPCYLGALMVFLFVLGLVIVDGPFKWWLGIATFLAMILATGHNSGWFNNFFFDHFPGYNKFRTVTMSLIITQFTVPLLGIMALYQVLKKEIPKERVLNGIYIAGGITGGLCLIFLLFGSSLLNFTGGGDKQFQGAQSEILTYLKIDRLSLLRSDALRSLILIAIGAGVVWAYIQDKLSKNIAICIVIVACLFDYIGVGKRFVNSDSFADQKEKQGRFAMSPADEAITHDQSLDFRVFNTTVNSFNDASTSYYHKSVGGYHAAKLRRYQELIENQISKGNMAVLDMLNTKYIIQKGPSGMPAAGQNPGACGNAWFVNRVQVVKNADEEIRNVGPIFKVKYISGSKLYLNGIDLTGEALIGYNDKLSDENLGDKEKAVDLSSYSSLQIGQKEMMSLPNASYSIEKVSNFDPLETAFVDQQFTNDLAGFTGGKDSASGIRLVSYAPNDLNYEYTAPKTQAAVFSEIYYQPGWVATVDGKETPIFRTDYVLRGMILPAGSHRVEMKFEPKSYYTGEKVAMATSILILLLLGGALFLEFKPKKPNAV